MEKIALITGASRGIGAATARLAGMELVVQGVQTGGRRPASHHVHPQCHARQLFRWRKM